MNRFFKTASVALLTTLLLWSCEKEENRVILTGGDAPEVTASSIVDSTEFNFIGSANNAVTLNWTNPSYTFNTGITSLDVAYTIEIDVVGANFNSTNKKQVVVSKDLTYTFTVERLNAILVGDMKLPVNTEQFVEMRVISSLANGEPALISNIIQLPGYLTFEKPPTVLPPSTGQLYITGSATPASWQAGNGEAAPPDQIFTQVTPTLYELTINLTGGGSYLFLPRYGTWNAVAPDPNKYGFTGANNENKTEGDTFKGGGGDMIAPASSGLYKIVVDFKEGKFTVTPV